MSMRKSTTLVSQVFTFLGHLLAFIISLALCVPVILLPLATAVPIWAWIPLATVGSYSEAAGALYASVDFTEYDLSEPWVKEIRDCVKRAT